MSNDGVRAPTVFTPPPRSYVQMTPGQTSQKQAAQSGSFELPDAARIITADPTSDAALQGLFQAVKIGAGMLVVQGQLEAGEQAQKISRPANRAARKARPQRDGALRESLKVSKTGKDTRNSMRCVENVASQPASSHSSRC